MGHAVPSTVNESPVGALVTVMATVELTVIVNVVLAVSGGGPLSVTVMVV